MRVSVWSVEVTPLSAIALVVAAVVTLGQWAREDLRTRPQCFPRFDAIRCEPAPPPGCKEFLREVQYEAELPDRLDPFDARLAEQLRLAFERHAWVEEVERVEVSLAGPLLVRLRYRAPVLAISDRGRERVVDGNGVLLPRAAVALGLPLLRGQPAIPPGPTGTSWNDPQVLAAARTSSFLSEQGSRPRLDAIEFDRGELVLWTASGSRLVWGNAPGQEVRGEAMASLKHDRLLDQLVGDPSAGPFEYDLRPSTGATRRPLARGVQIGARGGR